MSNPTTFTPGSADRKVAASQLSSRAFSFDRGVAEKIIRTQPFATAGRRDANGRIPIAGENPASPTIWQMASPARAAGSDTPHKHLLFRPCPPVACIPAAGAFAFHSVSTEPSGEPGGRLSPSVITNGWDGSVIRSAASALAQQNRDTTGLAMCRPTVTPKPPVDARGMEIPITG